MDLPTILEMISRQFLRSVEENIVEAVLKARDSDGNTRHQQHRQLQLYRHQQCHQQHKQRQQKQHQLPRGDTELRRDGIDLEQMDRAGQVELTAAQVATSCPWSAMLKVGLAGQPMRHAAIGHWTRPGASASPKVSVKTVDNVRALLDRIESKIRGMADRKGAQEAETRNVKPTLARLHHLATSLILPFMQLVATTLVVTLLSEAASHIFKKTVLTAARLHPFRGFCWLPFVQLSIGTLATNPMILEAIQSCVKTLTLAARLYRNGSSMRLPILELVVKMLMDKLLRAVVTVIIGKTLHSQGMHHCVLPFMQLFVRMLTGKILSVEAMLIFVRPVMKFFMKISMDRLLSIETMRIIIRASTASRIHYSPARLRSRRPHVLVRMLTDKFQSVVAAQIVSPGRLQGSDSALLELA